MPESILVASPWRRENQPVLLSLYGFSGCGKTLSSLLIARGLAGPAGRIGIIDTERGRAKVHAGRADIGGVDHVVYGELTPPFTPERYVDALQEMYAAKLDALVLDSASHEWDSEGGVIDLAENNRTSSGRETTGLNKWRMPKARHKKFMATLLRHPCHLIVCFRAKRKFVQRKDVQGRDEIVAAGAVPIQEFGFIYETTAQLFLPVPDEADDGKGRGVPRVDRCPDDLLPNLGAGKQITVETGAAIRAWASAGAKIDESSKVLALAARDAAAEGTAAYKRFWDGLKPGDRKKLEGEHGNLKSIAAAADDERTRAADAERQAKNPAASSTSAATDEWPAYRDRILGEIRMAADSADPKANVTRILSREVHNLSDAPQEISTLIRTQAADAMKRGK